MPGARVLHYGGKAVVSQEELKNSKDCLIKDLNPLILGDGGGAVSPIPYVQEQVGGDNAHCFVKILIPVLRERELRIWDASSLVAKVLRLTYYVERHSIYLYNPYETPRDYFGRELGLALYDSPTILKFRDF